MTKKKVSDKFSDMKPFNLEDALAGKPLVTRDNQPVVRLIQFSNRSKGLCLEAQVDGERRTWDAKGNYYEDVLQSRFDLFMAPIDDIKAEIAELQKLNAELTKEREELKAQAERQSQYIASLNDELNESLNKAGRQWRSISTPPTAEDGVIYPDSPTPQVLWLYINGAVRSDLWNLPTINGAVTHWTTLPAFAPKDELSFKAWHKEFMDEFTEEYSRPIWNAARKEKS